MVYRIIQRTLSDIFERSYILTPLKSLCDNVLLNVRPVQAFLVKGLIRNSNLSITTLFVGSEESAYQFAYLIHNEIERITPLGKFMLRDFDPSNLQDVELVVFKTNGSPIRKFLNKDYLLLPIMDFSLSLRESLHEIIKRSSRRRRRSIKKFQDFNYSYTIRRNSEKVFDYFYWKMYLPYAKNRFGRGAIIVSYSKLKALYKRNGGIVFVKNGEQNIVGLLFYIKGKTVYAKSLGVLETTQSVENGLAGQAALFFLIKWAKEQGINSLNYGKTMPFLRDGIFMYKKEWGMHLEQHIDDPFYALRLNCLNERTLSLLQQNPFIFLNKGAMKGIFLVNSRLENQDLKQNFSKHFLPGLDSLTVISYYRHDKKTETESPTTEKSTKTLMQPLLNTCLFLQKQGFTVEVHTLKRERANHSEFFRCSLEFPHLKELTS